MHDLLIVNGLVVDGTGAEPVQADVAVSDGVITEIGQLAGQRARRTIDAEGQAVTPGFVDVHTHFDAQIAWDPQAESSCFHGVTTAVMGNCGFTLAPVRSGEESLVVKNLERAEDIAAEAMAEGIDWSWETFPQYLDFVDRTPKAINFAANVGHSALRTWAMGERAFEQGASDDDLAAMAAHVKASLEAGAVGFTTSLSVNHETADDLPVASRMADWREVERLVGVMGELRTGIFELAHHPDLRSRDPEKREAYITKMVTLAAATRVPFTYGMLAFSAAEHTWKPVVELLERINAAGGTAWGQVHTRQFGVLLSFETRLPFDRLPLWSELRARPLDEQLAALRDPATRKALIESAESGDFGRAIGAETRKPEWQWVYPLDTPLPPFRSIQQIAQERSQSPTEVFIDLAVAKNLKGFFIQAAANQDQGLVLDLMRHPYSIPTFSDSGAHVSQIMDSSLHTHLLGHWVRDQEAFTLSEAIKKITSIPARAWGFTDRGVLAEGQAADINVFDPATVSPAMPELLYDLPGGARRLRQKAHGFAATVVNGEVTVEAGEPNHTHSGRLLRGPLAGN